MIELSEKLVKFIKNIPSDILSNLWSISQLHDYASVREEREWNEEDEFWRQVGYAQRVGGI